MSRKQGERPVFTVILRRSRGRYVKEAQRFSRYAAKQLAAAWEEKYDDNLWRPITAIRAADNVPGALRTGHPILVPGC